MSFFCLLIYWFKTQLEISGMFLTCLFEKCYFFGYDKKLLVGFFFGGGEGIKPIFNSGLFFSIVYMKMMKTKFRDDWYGFLYVCLFFWLCEKVGP